MDDEQQVFKFLVFGAQGVCNYVFQNMADLVVILPLPRSVSS